jgi:hypothetical protein
LSEREAQEEDKMEATAQAEELRVAQELVLVLVQEDREELNLLVEAVAKTLRRELWAKVDKELLVKLEEPLVGEVVEDITEEVEEVE